MKITISPSIAGNHGYTSVTIDLLTDDESTAEIIEAAMNAIIAAGHSRANVIQGAADWAEKQGRIDSL